MVAFRAVRQLGYAWKRGLGVGVARAGLVAGGAARAAAVLAGAAAAPVAEVSRLDAAGAAADSPRRRSGRRTLGPARHEDFHLARPIPATSIRWRASWRGVRALGCYYSGYPRGSCGAEPALPVRTHSLRTNVVYGLLKFVPERWRPSSRSLFLWQDHGFDAGWARISTRLRFHPCHAGPGARRLFARRGARGIRTVLNHATGPVREWVRIMEPEYAPRRLAADRCAARTTTPISPARRRNTRWPTGIARLPRWCASNSSRAASRPSASGRCRTARTRRIFHPAREAPRAGGISHRLRRPGRAAQRAAKTLLDALTLAAPSRLAGGFLRRRARRKRSPISTPIAAPRRCIFTGRSRRTPWRRLFARGSVLVLPSLEEGFGLVVPQALNCGLPAIVSDRVGGKDLVRHRENGSIFPVGNAAALAAELAWWAEHPRARERKIWLGRRRRAHSLQSAQRAC